MRGHSSENPRAGQYACLPNSSVTKINRGFPGSSLRGLRGALRAPPGRLLGQAIVPRNARPAHRVGASAVAESGVREPQNRHVVVTWELTKEALSGGN